MTRKTCTVASWIVICCAPVLLRASAAQADPVRTPVAVLPLHFAGELVSADRSVLAQRLVLGLKATQLSVVSGDSVTQALGQRSGATCDAGCRRELAAQLEVRYVVGGEVAGKHDNYRLHLWAADGYSGKPLAEVERACDICGVTELANTMELAASALHVKLKSLRKRVSELRISTDPPGAEIAVDGDVVGVTPRTVELPPGEHEVTLRAAGHLTVVRRVSAVSGIREQLRLELVPTAGNEWRRPVGWGVLGAGVVAVVVGGVLLGIDGDPKGCEAGQLRVERCSDFWQTAALGGVATGLGIAAAGAGIYLMLSGRSDERQDVALLPSPTGLSVRGRF
jgi:TolB-like protein